MVSSPLKSYLFWSRTLCSLLVLRRFNCVLIVMLFILVRSSMKMEKSSNRVAEDAFFDEKTYIDSSHGKGTDFSKAITDRLEFLTEVKSHSLMSTWSTVHSPFVVLAILQDLGFSVVTANTVGVTTVWTLRGSLNVQR